MNIIKTKVDFTKGTCTVSGINLVEGDYNSTKIEFIFDREDGTKVFEMKSPSEQLVAYQEIYNNEIILYGLKDVTTEHNSKTYTKYTKNDAIYWYQPTDNKLFTDAWVEVVTFDLTEYTKATEKASIFTEEGNYIFEISLYEDDSKLTSASGKIKVKAEQVKIDDNMVTPYIPIFDELMQDVETALGNIEDKITEVNTAIIQTNNLDLDVSKSGKVATVTLTKKDNTTKTVTLSDGTSLQFNWDGTKLGVKTDNDESYTYVDLKGETGETGATPSLSIGTVSTGSPSAVTITGTDENPVLNFTLEKGETGATGATGNGIASITKISSVDTTDTYRITFTDGTTYDYEITNGEVSQAQLDELQAQVDRYKMLENALPHITGTGTELTLDNTANASMTIDLEPNTSQETTTGKNLLPNYNPYPYEISRGITFTKNADGTYTLNGTNDGTGNSALFLITQSDTPLTLEAGTYYTIATNVDGLSITGFDGTNYIVLARQNNNSFTLENDTTFVQVYIQRGKGYSTQLNNVKVYPIISKTSVDATSYEPYTNGASPNSNYPQDIHVVSGDNTLLLRNRNLWNENWEQGYYNANGNKVDATANSIRSVDFIPVQPNTNYYYYNGTNSAGRMCFYDKDKNFISTLTNSNAIRTTPNNCYYVTISTSTNYGSTYNNDICINVSNESYNGTYEPHEEQTAQLNLPVKNFLNIDNSESGGINAQGELTTGNTTWRANSFIKVQPNTTYTFSRKQFNDTVQRAIRLYEYNSSQSFITPRAESYEKTLTITTSANTYYLKWSIFENQANFTKSIVETWNLQIELGTKANSYTPYGTEPIEYCKIPNSDYKDKFVLNINSNNLFDKSTITTGKMINKNTGNPDNDSGTNCSDYIDVSKFANVILSGATISYSNGGAFYDGNKTYVSGFSSTNIKNGLVIPSNAVYLRFNILPVDVDITMLNKGITVLPYEPHTDNKWYLKKNIPEYVITGNENGLGTHQYGTNSYQLSGVLNFNFDTSKKQVLCNYFKGVSNDERGTGNNIIYTNNATTLVIRNTSFDSLNSFKTWLQEKYSGSNPVKVKYVASTPEYILLNNTLQEALNTLESKLLAYKGQTSISQINNDLPFEIVASALKDISNL